MSINGHRIGRGASRPGFTLVEVGAVGALFVVGAALLQPLGPMVRAEARLVGSQDMQQTLAKGQFQYASEHDDSYAGPNTSGACFQGLGPVPCSAGLLGNTTSDTPTQVQDWISPIVGASAGLPVNRAERIAEIFERFRAPDVRAFNDFLYGGAADAADFENLGPVRQVSFLSPRAFHVDSVLGPPRPVPCCDIGHLKRDMFGRPVITPEDFRPTFAHVGPPSQKILIADGTRYVAGSPESPLLDIDINPDPTVFGNFLTAGPTYDSSTAYGRNSPSGGANLDYSFRARNGTGIVTTAFDGSSRFMTREEAWTNPTPWYPSGSVFVGGTATPESIDYAVENYEPNPNGSGLIIP